MSANKLHSHSSKTSSYRLTTSRPSSVKSTKPRPTKARKIIPSKKITPSISRKACSADVFDDNRKNTKPEKTTKSDFNVKKDHNKKATQEAIDYCKNCGDVLASSIPIKKTASDYKSIQTTKSKSDIKNNKNKKSNSNSVFRNSNSYTRNSSSNSRNSTSNSRKYNGYFHSDNAERKQEPVKQYYKNENYHLSESTDDITNGIKKISLDTIKEVSEKHPSDSIFKIYPDDSEEDITFLDVDDEDCLKQLKEFRQKNYFECHSAKSRIRNKGSATSLNGHRCVYRFYLNDRLFPVPLSTDHNKQVRCVECHLPMELNVEDSTKINGTIQAKVSIGKKNQDIMLLLPVKEPLIITEKRREEKPQDRDVVFFGVINLDGIGNSMFNSTLPDNSLALKYQKGYHEFLGKDDYSYKDLDKADVIVI